MRDLTQPVRAIADPAARERAAERLIAELEGQILELEQLRDEAHAQAVAQVRWG